MHRIWRAGFALALAPWLIICPIVPTEHVHEEVDHHIQAVSHRHFAPHNVVHDHGASEISDRDQRVVWLDDMSLLRETFQLAVVLAVLPVALDSVPTPTGWIPASALERSLPHGPPGRASSLRGPPLPRLI